MDTPRVRHRFSDVEIDAALTAIAMTSGHREKARALLLEQGIEIAAGTLSDWKNKTKKQQYERVREEVAPIIKGQMADMHQQLATTAGEIESEALLRLQERIRADRVETKDLHGVARTAAIATGIHGEKHLLYSNQPTKIIQRDATEVLRDLEAMGYKPELIEGTAVEVPSAQ